MERKKFYFSCPIDWNEFMLFNLLKGVVGIKGNRKMLNFLVRYYCDREGIDVKKILEELRGSAS